ncbi:hypothetical protein FIM02_02950, partial [SAR202 cluster bacterium AD-802-E10_MRT_200m]|nr:hypothetical protein [SAR202 cluster bacterium AD-802-E10_MRT_200m]
MKRNLLEPFDINRNRFRAILNGMIIGIGIGYLIFGEFLLYKGDVGSYTPPQIIAEKEISWVNDIFSVNNRPIEYSKQELREKVKSLDLILNSNQPPVGSSGSDYLSALMEIADATYYTLHGQSLLDENLSVHILTEEEYRDW